ncbi:MAG: diacylglycerol kinase family lipid kinase [Clostridia bacterium]|nr:diacylglycerol kinase family lipid kinase [Clostridia bacterium]
MENAFGRDGEELREESRDGGGNGSGGAERAREYIAELPLFIINPIAGSGHCRERFEQAAEVFKKRGMQFRTRYTEREGHAAEIAQNAVKEGVRRIIAVGGDGTLNEVVSAVYDTEGVVLGILPFGTGNDFASAIKVPTDPVKAAELILDGEARSCDLGTANGRIFTNVCGLGFDVDVLLNTEKHKKGRSGMLPYVLGIVDSILHRKKVHAYVSLDGGEETELDSLIMTVCNGISFGGGMKVAPEAKQDDGLFDICIAKWVGLFRLITLLPKFIKGKHLGKKPVIYTRCREITIRTESRFTVELDGELIEKTPLSCKILPAAIAVIRPGPEEAKATEGVN